LRSNDDILIWYMKLEGNGPKVQKKNDFVKEMMLEMLERLEVMITSVRCTKKHAVRPKSEKNANQRPEQHPTTQPLAVGSRMIH
jgi:hypothetical protein